MSHQFKPGLYYVGDLCYYLDQEWDEVCELTIKGLTTFDGVFQLQDGRRFALYTTAYGDGTYSDQWGRDYGVDSGTLGCIAMPKDFRGIDGPFHGGRLQTFTQPFDTGYEDGVIRFGALKINTDLPYEDEQLELFEDTDE